MTTTAPDQIIKSYFLLATAFGLLSSSIPAIRKRFVEYGSRASGYTSVENPANSKDASNRTGEETTSTLVRMISLKIPHRYFTHFYAASIISSVFWAFQFLTFGYPLKYILDLQSASQPKDKPSMSRDQVVIVWAMMLVQGVRRLYESIVFARSSQSEMWVALYGLGVSFFIAAGVGIWIEGTPALQDHGIRFAELIPTAPSLRTFICVPVFILASGIQHDCHSYLASLKKYTLPVHPIFRNIVCPHYTAECVIYTALAVAAAPAGRLINPTLATTLIFTIVNLGATADSSKAWYVRKFGEESVKGKWRMIPLIY